MQLSFETRSTGSALDENTYKIKIHSKENL